MKPRYRSMVKKMAAREKDAPAETAEAVWSLYILRCGDGSFYTGVTTDIDRRFRAHQSGRASRSCRCPSAVPDVSSITFQPASCNARTRGPRL